MSDESKNRILALLLIAFFAVMYTIWTAQSVKPKTYKEGLIEGMNITVQCTIDMHDAGHTYEIVRKCFIDELAKINVKVEQSND